MKRQTQIGLVFVLLMLPALSAVSGKPEGWFGLGVTLDWSGKIWNPKVEKLTVSEVAAGSPAEQADVHEGEELIAIEGEPLYGKPAKQLGKLLARKPGETLTITLKSTSGERTVSMTAVPKPADQE